MPIYVKSHSRGGKFVKAHKRDAAERAFRRQGAHIASARKRLKKKLQEELRVRMQVDLVPGARGRERALKQHAALRRKIASL